MRQARSTDRSARRAGPRPSRVHARATGNARRHGLTVPIRLDPRWRAAVVALERTLVREAPSAAASPAWRPRALSSCVASRRRVRRSSAHSKGMPRSTCSAGSTVTRASPTRKRTRRCASSRRIAWCATAPRRFGVARKSQFANRARVRSCEIRRPPIPQSARQAAAMSLTIERDGPVTRLIRARREARNANGTGERGGGATARRRFGVARKSQFANRARVGSCEIRKPPIPRSARQAAAMSLTIERDGPVTRLIRARREARNAMEPASAEAGHRRAPHVRC